MPKGMAKQPVVFALAKPDPEIMPDEAKKARARRDIVATGRSDFPIRSTTCSAVPFIFRGGARCARANQITEEMKKGGDARG